MSGDQPIGNRALIAAGLFALVALFILFLVWRWSPFFDREVAEEEAGGAHELTIEEKFAILEQIRASEPEALATMSVDEKSAVLDSISSTVTASDEEKMQILESLGSN